MVKFSQGRCSSDEEAAIREWLQDGTWPELEAGEEIPGEIRTRVWNKLHEQITIPAPLIRRDRRRWWVAAAACLLLLTATAILLYQRHSGPLSDTRLFTTGPGVHKKIVLSDSSVVFLSPSSSLQVMQPFTGSRRMVQLSGEAVFEVSANPSRPFTVLAGKLSTTALGTSFKVSSFSKNNELRVALSYGKIRVEEHLAQGPEKSLTLNPGEEVIYNKTQGTLQKASATGQQFDYRNNILYFKNAGVAEVVQKLGSYYHKKVIVKGLADAKWSLSGEFDYRPLETVMQAIAYSCNIQYQLTDSLIVLAPNDPLPNSINTP